MQPPKNAASLEIRCLTGFGFVGLATFLLGATVLSAAAVRREEGIATGAVRLITEPAKAEQIVSTDPGTFGLYYEKWIQVTWRIEIDLYVNRRTTVRS